MKAARGILAPAVRAIGIVAICSIVGPLAFREFILPMTLDQAASFLELQAGDFVKSGSVSTLVPVAASVLMIGSLLAAFPSVMTGLFFALAAIYAGLSSVRMAWCATAAVIAALIVIGAFYVPDQSSAVLPPSIRGGKPFVRAFFAHNILAFLPTTFCCWLARPLHDVRIAV